LVWGGTATIEVGGAYGRKKAIIEKPNTAARDHAGKKEKRFPEGRTFKTRE